MKDGTKVLVGGLLGLIVVSGLVVYFAYGSYFLQKDLGPKQAALERKIFEESPSYIQGKNQELGKLRLELETNKDEVERKALRRRILEIADQVDVSKLTSENQAFLRDLRNQK